MIQEFTYKHLNNTYIEIYKGHACSKCVYILSESIRKICDINIFNTVMNNISKYSIDRNNELVNQIAIKCSLKNKIK